MADGQGEYKIKLTTEADLKGAREAQNAIDEQKVSVKGLEEAYKKTAAAAKSAQSVPWTPGTGLASTPNPSSVAKKAAEQAAGLRTENSMKAESENAAIHHERIQDFVKNARVGGAMAGGSPVGTAADVSSQASAVSSLSSAVGGLVGKYFTWYAAVKAVKAGLTETIVAAGEQERSLNRLSQALVQNGTYSQGYQGHLENLAVQFQKLTGIAQGDWLDAFAKLSQFGADSSNIDQYASAVKSLAGIYGNVGTATVAMSKALEGNFDSLREHGILIDQNATQAEKLKSLMEQLARVGGGQLESELRGLSGAWKGLEANSKDLGIQLGKHLVNFFQLERGARILSTASEYYADKLRVVADETGKVNLASAHHIKNQRSEADAARELQSEMEKLKNGYSNLQSQLSGMAGAYEKLDQAHGDTEAKKRDKELAIIRSKVERGIMTEQQGLIARAQIEDKYERLSEQRKERAIERDMALKDAELAAAVAQSAALDNQITQAKQRQTKRSEEEHQRAKAEAAKSLAQGTQREMDQLTEDMAMKAMVQGPGFWGGSEANEMTEKLGQLGFRKTKQDKVAQEESDKATEMKDRADLERKRIEKLQDLKLSQDQDVEKKRFDAFNTRNIGQGQLTEIRNQFNEGNQTRRIELNTATFQANGGLPAVNRNPADIARDSAQQVRSVQNDVILALRARDVETAQANIAILETLRASQRDIATFRRAVDIQRRQNANRPPE